MKEMKKRKPATDEEIYNPHFDIEEIMNDPYIKEQHEKHFKGDKLYQDTTSGGSQKDKSEKIDKEKKEQFPNFSTEHLELSLKVIREGKEPGETQRVGDKIEKELKRRKQEK